MALEHALIPELKINPNLAKKIAEARENIHEQHKHPELFEVKYMQNTTPAEINIWADKVMIVILTKKPTAILISNPKVAESYKTFFNLLWEAAK